jgi:hypothetical protein
MTRIGRVMDEEAAGFKSGHTEQLRGHMTLSRAVFDRC